jgi:hypothetical protein
MARNEKYLESSFSHNVRWRMSGSGHPRLLGTTVLMARHAHDALYQPRPREMRRQRPAMAGRVKRRPTPWSAVRASDQENEELDWETVRQANARSIERGLNNDGSGSPLARQVARAREKLSDDAVKALRRLLYALDSHGSLLLDEPETTDGVGRLAGVHEQWVRAPPDWVPRRGSVHQHFHSLACHLLCRYPVPFPSVGAWLHDTEWSRSARQWFIHIGAGRNLARAPGLPFPLTKAMAHHVLLAPDHLNFLQAMRWGQFMGLGVSETLATAAADSDLGRPWADESICLSFGHFLARFPELNASRVRPMVDYLYAVRHGRGCLNEQPGYRLAGRTPVSLEREIVEWHRDLARASAGLDVRWNKCGIAGLEPTDGPGGRKWAIVELTDAVALQAEGAALRHCVLTYSRWAAQGACAIFSLRSDRGEGCVSCITIQVSLPGHQIVQARGLCNRAPAANEWFAIRQWAQEQGLTIVGGR